MGRRVAPPSSADRERLDVAADVIADLLGVDPEAIGTEPSSLRLSLTLSQAERLIELASRCASCACSRPGCRNCDASTVVRGLRPGSLATDSVTIAPHPHVGPA